MKTLIDRDELYKALSQWDWQDLYLPVHFKELVDELPVVQHSYEDGIRKGYEDAVLHYAKMALRQWIPVSERLPKKDADILATYVDGEEARIVPVNYGDGTWYDCIFNSTLDSHKVVAWMPLPEPYKEGEIRARF